MKKILFLLSAFLICQFINAQGNIGIGTSSPNPKALLDITSTTKGFLAPRMNTSQRLSITTPPAGLLVYDTDKNEFYQYNGSNWRAILNSDYWSRPITARSRITNLNDSVGIGTNSPTEWLDVNGNIRARNNLLADNNITATGNVTGNQLNSTGDALVVGTSLLNGDVTTNSDLIINNAAAIVQLKSSSVSKGFFQLSGDNVRIGTNSGNTTGKFIIRNNSGDRVFVNPTGEVGVNISDPLAQLHINSGTSNTTLRLQANGAPSLQFYTGSTSIASIQATGNNLRIIAPGNNISLNDVLYADDASNRVGIGTNAPAQKLHVVGKLKVSGTAMTIDDGSITGTTTGSTFNLLPVCYGKVSGGGNRLGGTLNFTVVHALNDGTYHLSGPELTSSSIIIVTATSTNSYYTTANVQWSDFNGAWIIITSSNGSLLDSPFHFVVFSN